MLTKCHDQLDHETILFPDWMTFRSRKSPDEALTELELLEVIDLKAAIYDSQFSSYTERLE
jgi:hypothetical protein